MRSIFIQSRKQRFLPQHVTGFSLIELMVALVLGLLVVAAAIGIFLSNQQAYRASESLGRVQESARVAFELMARDVREAGGNPCNSWGNMAIVNVLNSPASNWWSNWGIGTTGGSLRGYSGAEAINGIPFGSAAAQRVAGTDALVVLSGGDIVANVTAHDPSAATFTVNNAAHGFSTGDILLVCGPNSESEGVVRLGAIFQMTNGGGTTSIAHAVGGGSPGNAISNLGLSGGGIHLWRKCFHNSSQCRSLVYRE
ncbi:PilW family protein [Pseudoxanthomonas kalamensis]|uniref:PilW family protein n=1 Tax=Pseudoxanthomonas kalamensis TaxID=289483 RepID=UPI001FE6C9FC|nr:prepilin-type N-terminal cleavage/methylation domain-containing protein [Pseudoxanthomonas kalamensis]